MATTSLAPPPWIEIAGFKSLREPQRVHLRPLTLLAGGNSSGKSSVMQALLLLKQTLEASFDPGPLLLDGPHVRFTDLGQVFSRGKRNEDRTDAFSITFGGVTRLPTTELSFRRRSSGDSYNLAAPRLAALLEDRRIELGSGMPVDDAFLLRQLTNNRPEAGPRRRGRWEASITVNRFSPVVELAQHVDDQPNYMLPLDLLSRHRRWLASIFHLPGLRGHRERLYEAAWIGPASGPVSLSGPFTPYTAAIVNNWQEQDGLAKIHELGKALKAMGLTWKVKARKVNASQVELKVARMPSWQSGGSNDLVDVADVGFGVSQVLPVVVALLTAEPRQLVYIEQPELHLHPRAQLALGRLLVETAGRGVRVVAETHSRMILRAIQAAVGRDEIKTDKVGLHWFTRHPETGMSTVSLADLQPDGSFGEWPVDFSETEDEADLAYLEAAAGV